MLYYSVAELKKTQQNKYSNVVGPYKTVQNQICST